MRSRGRYKEQQYEYWVPNMTLYYTLELAIAMILEQDLYKIEPANTFSRIKELSMSHPSLKIYLQIMVNDRRDFLQ